MENARFPTSFWALLLLLLLLLLIMFLLMLLVLILLMLLVFLFVLLLMLLLEPFFRFLGGGRRPQFGPSTFGTHLKQQQIIR